MNKYREARPRHFERFTAISLLITWARDVRRSRRNLSWQYFYLIFILRRNSLISAEENSNMHRITWQEIKVQDRTKNSRRREISHDNPGRALDPLAASSKIVQNGFEVTSRSTGRNQRTRRCLRQRRVPEAQKLQSCRSQRISQWMGGKINVYSILLIGYDLLSCVKNSLHNVVLLWISTFIWKFAILFSCSIYSFKLHSHILVIITNIRCNRFVDW